MRHQCSRYYNHVSRSFAIFRRFFAKKLHTTAGAARIAARVSDGDAVVPVANRLIENGGYGLIVASQDWHPPGHGSFASSHPGKQPFEMGELSGKPQVMWPDHCVQNTPDADFHPELNVAAIDHVQRKGENPDVDSYSAFFENDKVYTAKIHIGKDGHEYFVTGKGTATKVHNTARMVLQK